MVEKEHIKNRIGDDLNKRNKNWDILQDQVNKVGSLENRVDTIITTPVGGAATQQEIVDARDGETTLGKNIHNIKNKVDKQEAIHRQLSRIVSKSQQEIAGINVNQEAKQTAEGRRIVSLPKTAGEGHGEFSLKGLTATNLIENGDFRDGANGWTGTTKDIRVVNEGLSVKVKEGISNINTLDKTLTTPINSGEIVYIYYDVESQFDRDSDMMGYLEGSSASERLLLPNFTLKSYQRIIKSHRLTSEVDKLRTIKMLRTLPKIDGFKYLLRNAFLVNLTQTFGAGNEPTKEECDEIFANYFEGTQSVNGNVRVKSVGKNLFDKNDVVLGGYFSERGDLDQRGNAGHAESYIKNHGEQEYITNKSLALYTYDEDKKPIKRVITTPNVPFVLGSAYFRISSGILESIMDELQLERGSNATPYQPYTDSTLYLNAPKLRSLPNGVADSIENGVFVRRVGEITYNTNVALGVSGRGDVDWVRLNTPELKSLKSPVGGIRCYLNNLQTHHLGFNVPEQTAEDISSVWKTYEGVSNGGFISIITPKGFFADVADANAYFKNKPLLVHYQLTEPEIIPLYPSGNLITQPSGTVYIEDVVADVATYSANAEIGRTKLSIKELDQLSVMDFETGNERKLKVNEAVISTDKLSFTHPELKNGDIVFFEYYYDEEGTDGLASVEYFDSRYTLVDDVTGVVYEWSLGVSNGEPIIKLKEV